MLEALAKIGGLSSLSVGVLYLLYREMIRRDVFTRMTGVQTFSLFSMIAVLVAFVTFVAILTTDKNLAAAIGYGNTINQGIAR